MTGAEVTEHLLARSRLTFSRSSGPGGQHRDHAETRAEIVVTRAALDGLPEDLADRLTARLNLARRPLRLVSQRDRSRERNRATVERALRTRVEAALRPAAPRRATRPTAASVARRLDQKARRSQTKAMRRRPGDD